MKNALKNKKNWLYIFFIFLVTVILFTFFCGKTISYKLSGDDQIKEDVPQIPPLDKEDYDRRLNLLAHIATSTATTTLATTSTSTSTIATSTSTSTPKKISLWPVKTVYPNAGAILPFNRIVAYYGNLLSTKMGVLGEYPEDEMLAKLKADTDKWTLADPGTPAIPALHYIAVTAQGHPGDDGKYRLRMPDTEIDKVIAMAAKINALVFLDIQVGQSTIQDELPLLEKYLKLPQVHLAIDPEFSMKNKEATGRNCSSPT